MKMRKQTILTKAAAVFLSAVILTSAFFTVQVKAEAAEAETEEPAVTEAAEETVSEPEAVETEEEADVPEDTVSETEAAEKEESDVPEDEAAETESMEEAMPEEVTFAEEPEAVTEEPETAAEEPEETPVEEITEPQGVMTVMAGSTKINKTNFPDEAFREYVAGFDTDADGTLSAAEKKAVKKIDVIGNGKITSLAGIEYFTGLEELECSFCAVKELDISQNTALTHLQCAYNNLTKLDVSSCAKLQNLNCSGNNLSALDVSGCTGLITLSCSANKITALDVSKCASLDLLNCSQNNLTELDLSKNTGLTNLVIFGNKLKKIDVSKCKNIVFVLKNYVNKSIDESEGNLSYFYYETDGSETITNVMQFSYDLKTTVVTGALFTDVPLTHNFSRFIYWAYSEGITGGIGNTGRFGVKDDVTRGQVVMFLWRAAGQPEPKKKTQTFKDVPTTHNFYKAIQWASEQGITGGYTGKKAGYFGPNDNCTRGQIVTFMWRFAGQDAPKGKEQTFSDVPVKHNFYRAVQWAYENAITTGYSSGAFGVSDTCTRGQCVTFLFRLVNSTLFLENAVG